MLLAAPRLLRRRMIADSRAESRVYLERRLDPRLTLRKDAGSLATITPHRNVADWVASHFSAMHVFDVLDIYAYFCQFRGHYGRDART